MSKFDWDNLKQNLNDNALEDGNKKTYEADERFYKLSRNENDQGGALIRFLPDPTDIPFIKMTKISANKGYQKRFINGWSPASIGLPDPINERFLSEWQAGNKEEAKRFGRSFRYIANIKVIKDPSNPSNEGKIFLLDMSKTLFEKVKNAASPSPDEIALGTEAIQVFNPLEGNNFLLKVNRAATGFISYETSKFDDKITAAYKNEKEYEKDIKANGFKLNTFLEPESFLSYDELVDKLKWYLNEQDTPAANKPAVPKETVETKETVEPKETTKPAEPVGESGMDDDLDELLADFE